MTKRDAEDRSGEVFEEVGRGSSESFVERLVIQWNIKG